MNTPTNIVQIIGTKRLHKETCSQIGKRAYRYASEMTDAELAKATKATCCRPIAADALIGGAALRLADADGTTPAPLARVTAVEVDGVKVAETRHIDIAPKVAAPKAATAKDGERATKTFDGTDTTHKCRTCETVKETKKFPTISGTTKRGTECRACRDARRGKKVKA